MAKTLCDASSLSGPPAIQQVAALYLNHSGKAAFPAAQIMCKTLIQAVDSIVGGQDSTGITRYHKEEWCAETYSI